MTQPSDSSAAESEAARSCEAIRARLEAAPSHGDLRDFIFGAAMGLGWWVHVCPDDTLPRFPDYVEDSRQSRSFVLPPKDSE